MPTESIQYEEVVTFLPFLKQPTHQYETLNIASDIRHEQAGFRVEQHLGTIEADLR